MPRAELGHGRAPYADEENEIAALAETVASRGWQRARIGIDTDSWARSVRRFRAMQAALPGVRFVEAPALVRELSFVKSPAEVEVIRQAAAIADAAMRAGIDALGEGARERDAAAVVARVFYEPGADNGRTGPITSGSGWGFLHAPMHERALRAGDVVHMELAPRRHGYSARLMRCTVIGPPGDEQLRAAERLRDIQDEQIAAMRPGAPAREVDAICREGALGAGLRERYDNITGYTLGYYADHGPRTSDFTRCFSASAGWTLEAGQVFHMYVSAAGVAFSETVLVGTDGHQRPTRMDRALYSV